MRLRETSGYLLVITIRSIVVATISGIDRDANFLETSNRITLFATSLYLLKRILRILNLVETYDGRRDRLPRDGEDPRVRGAHEQSGTLTLEVVRAEAPRAQRASGLRQQTRYTDLLTLAPDRIMLGLLR